MRDHDRLERCRPWQERPGAHKADRQPCLAAPLHQKTREIERVADVGRLKLVETSPYEAGGSEAHVEIRRNDVEVEISGPDDDLRRRAVAGQDASIREEPVDVTRNGAPEGRTQFVVPFRKQTSARHDNRLPARGLVNVREHVDDDRCVTIDLRKCRNRNEERDDRCRDRPHAADPSRATAGAPKRRGKSVITAGTTSTSARNATTIVSASRPPNQAVGLYAETTMIP